MIASTANQYRTGKSPLVPLFRKGENGLIGEKAKDPAARSGTRGDPVRHEGGIPNKSHHVTIPPHGKEGFPSQ